MKKLLIAIAAVLVTAASYGQGQINFNNRVNAATPPVNAPVTVLGTGAGAGTIANMKAQLFLVSGSTKTAIGDVGTFRTTPAAATAFMSQSITVVVPGIDVGGSATVVMRAWSGATFDSSSATPGEYFGESGPITITLGGGTGVPADLSGLQAFTVTTVPEPTTLALGAIGAAALLLRRRK